MEKLRIFGVGYMTGDGETVLPLLHQAFPDFSDIETNFAALKVVINKEPYQRIVDEATGLLVTSHLLTHRTEGWRVGTVDLVLADEDRYNELLKSI